jgi:hypothetical protein
VGQNRPELQRQWKEQNREQVSKIYMVEWWMLELMTMRLVARTSKSMLDLGICSVSILVQSAKKLRSDCFV